MKTRKWLICLMSAAGLLLVCSSPSLSVPLMVEKNLFSKSRKPLPPRPATTSRSKRSYSKPRGIQLDGIMVHGKTRRALVRLKGSRVASEGTRRQSPFLVVLEGDTIGELKVTRINIRSIWIEKEGSQYALELFSKKSRIVDPGRSPAIEGENSAIDSGG